MVVKKSTSTGLKKKVEVDDEVEQLLPSEGVNEADSQDDAEVIEAGRSALHEAVGQSSVDDVVAARIAELKKAGYSDSAIAKATGSQ